MPCGISTPREKLPGKRHNENVRPVRGSVITPYVSERCGSITCVWIVRASAALPHLLPSPTAEPEIVRFWPRDASR
jgi:hypothetical protein